jgi:hypothetical protein
MTPSQASGRSPLQAVICLIRPGVENIDGGIGRLRGGLLRILPARSEMVTTLIAQMSDLLAPISKSTTRT